MNNQMKILKNNIKHWLKRIKMSIKIFQKNIIKIIQDLKNMKKTKNNKRKLKNKMNRKKFLKNYNLMI